MNNDVKNYQLKEMKSSCDLEVGKVEEKEMSQHDKDKVQRKMAQQKIDNSMGLRLQLSKSLHQKIVTKAQAEGVSPEDLASELLAEGLVLRAWEIMERKSTMRSNGNGNNNSYVIQANRSSNKQSYRGNHQNQYNGRGRNSSPNSYHQNSGSNYSGSNNNHGRRSNYQHILEDSANFLEYVRNQEKKNCSDR